MPAPASITAINALTDWWEEMGVDVDHARVDAFLKAAESTGSAAPQQNAPVRPRRRKPTNWVEEARSQAAGCDTLNALKAAIESFEGSPLKAAAHSTVVYDGTPGASLMVIGEGPGAEEDRKGLPFVGKAGQLLDRMLDAIGMGRAHPDALKSVYITNILPWRPPQNRDPTPEEIGMMLPFVARHVQLAEPDVLVLMGNISCLALLGRKGITRLRGTWTEALGKPALPMFHPAYLLRNGHAKRDAWHDLLMLQDRLRRAE